jgi:hypothetical protein
LALLLAIAACAKSEGGDSPPGADGGADASVAEDGAAPVDAGRPDAPQGQCQLTGQERSLDPVPTGAGNHALAWDGTRLVTVYQYEPGYAELRFAASDSALAALGSAVTFTQGLVDCSLSVAACHGEPALVVDAAGAFTVVWAGYDPPHGAVGLHYGHLDADGVLSGHLIPILGGADPVASPALVGNGDHYWAAWQLGPRVWGGELQHTGVVDLALALTDVARTAERPLLAVDQGVMTILYTWKTGVDSSKLVLWHGRLAEATETRLDLGLTRPRAAALLELDGVLVAVIEAEAPAGRGWSAAWVATLDPATGALLSGPDPALLAGAGGGVVVDSAIVTPAGDIAIGATVYDAADSRAVLQRVNRWGQTLHPAVQASDGHASLAPVGMSTRVAWMGDRFVVSFVVAPVADAGVLYLRTVTCDF